MRELPAVHQLGRQTLLPYTHFFEKSRRLAINWLIKHHTVSSVNLKIKLSLGNLDIAFNLVEKPPTHQATAFESSIDKYWSRNSLIWSPSPVLDSIDVIILIASCNSLNVCDVSDTVLVTELNLSSLSYEYE